MTSSACKVCGREPEHGDMFVTTVSRLSRVECTECIRCRCEYLRYLRETGDERAQKAIDEAERSGV